MYNINRKHGARHSIKYCCVFECMPQNQLCTESEVAIVLHFSGMLCSLQMKNSTRTVTIENMEGKLYCTIDLVLSVRRTGTQRRTKISHNTYMYWNFEPNQYYRATIYEGKLRLVLMWYFWTRILPCQYYNTVWCLPPFQFNNYSVGVGA